VLVHDLVLGRGDPQRGVLVRDPGQQVLGDLLGALQQRVGEHRDGAGQRHLLGPLRLVAPVEGAVQQLRVGVEQVRVEASGDLLDVVADDGQGGLDDRT
jgi:hypothetical protein